MLRLRRWLLLAVSLVLVGLPSLPAATPAAAVPKIYLQPCDKSQDGLILYDNEIGEYVKCHYISAFRAWYWVPLDWISGPFFNGDYRNSTINPRNYFPNTVWGNGWEVSNVEEQSAEAWGGLVMRARNQLTNHIDDADQEYPQWVGPTPDGEGIDGGSASMVMQHYLYYWDFASASWQQCFSMGASNSGWTTFYLETWFAWSTFPPDTGWPCSQYATYGADHYSLIDTFAFKTNYLDPEQSGGIDISVFGDDNYITPIIIYNDLIMGALEAAVTPTPTPSRQPAAPAPSPVKKAAGPTAPLKADAVRAQITAQMNRDAKLHKGQQGWLDVPQKTASMVDPSKLKMKIRDQLVTSFPVNHTP